MSESERKKSDMILVDPLPAGREIKKVAVIGAGAMGGGISAHLANAGVEVYMLDRNPAAPQAAIARMLKATPATDPLNAGFMAPENAKLIKTGNTDDNLEEAVKDADWIVEVIVEDLGLKRKLFEQIDKYRKPGAVVSSNTSTIPLKEMAEGRSDDFRKNFIITHFFNPPRFMRLLELISGPDTDPVVTKTMKDFCDLRLGKNVVESNDTPGFIANRIGAYFLFRAIIGAMDAKLKIGEVDAILGKPLGFPKDGVFGLLDMVGIGLIPHITKSLKAGLPADDGFNAIYREPRLIETLLAHGRWGRNAPDGGFYRMLKNEDGSKIKQVIDLPKVVEMLESGEWEKAFGAPGAAVKNPDILEKLYGKAEKPNLKSVKAGKKGPRAVFEAGDPAADFAWQVMRDTLLYAAAVMPGPSDDIAAIDAAMRDGYNWKQGPFEMLDKIGLGWFLARARKDGVKIPPVLEMAEKAGGRFYGTGEGGKPQRLAFDFAAGTAQFAPVKRPEGVVSLADFKQGRKPLVSTQSASLWDIGDGVACLEFHSKLNTIDPAVIKGVNDSIDFINASKGRFKSMVIYNDSSNFSAGANLAFAQAVGKYAGVKHVEDIVYFGQRVYQALRYAPFPVVGAPSGMALGGACEILLHCDAIQASSETYTGLVEMGVGLIPGWCGTARMLERAENAPGAKKGPFMSVKTAFQTIMTPNVSVSTSGQDAKNKMWLHPGDGITMNRDRLLADAKAKALELVPGYAPPKPSVFHLPGQPAKTALRMAVDDFYRKGDATWYDVVIGDALAEVLSGGDTRMGIKITEEQLLQKEREAFLSLLINGQTGKRISHIIRTDKPLREEPLTDGRTTADLRALRKDAGLDVRPYDGKTLRGKDKLKLNALSAATWLMYKFV